MSPPRRRTSRAGLAPNSLQWAILAVAVLLIGVLGFRQLQRWQGRTTIWVAAGDLATGAVVEAANLRSLSVPRSSVPGSVLQERSEIEGRQLVRAKRDGVAFFARDFEASTATPGPTLSELVPEGRVLMTLNLATLPVEELVQSLRFGDRFDFVAFRRRGGPGDDSGIYGRNARVVARDAFFVGWVGTRRGAGQSAGGSGGGGNGNGGGIFADLLQSPVASQGGGRSGPSPLLLGVHPEDALSLAQAEAEGARLSLIVHKWGEADDGNLLELPRPPLSEVELIAGGDRQRIPVELIQLR